MDPVVIIIPGALSGLNLTTGQIEPVAVVLATTLAPFIITLLGGTPGVPIASWQFNDGTDVHFNDDTPVTR